MLPSAMSGQGLVLAIGADEELIRFAFLNKVPFSAQQLGLMAKSLGLSLRMVGKTSSVEQAVGYARAIALNRLPKLEEAARLSLIRAIVEPMAMSNLDDPVLTLVLEDMSRDHPSYKDFEQLHQQVKGHKAAPAQDECAGRAGCHRGPTVQVTDLAYRAAPSKLTGTVVYVMCVCNVCCCLWPLTTCIAKALIPGDGQIPGCRLVVSDLECNCQGRRLTFCTSLGLCVCMPMKLHPSATVSVCVCVCVCRCVCLCVCVCVCMSAF